jgi:hypothetical protein
MSQKTGDISTAVSALIIALLCYCHKVTLTQCKKFNFLHSGVRKELFCTVLHVFNYSTAAHSIKYSQHPWQMNIVKLIFPTCVLHGGKNLRSYS